MKVTATLGRVGTGLVITAPKTPRSRRMVPLSPAMVVLLKAQRVTQVTERLHAGGRWVDSGLVFTTELGTPVDPRNVLRAIQIAADKAGVKGVGVHTLRHSAAVSWLEAGTHIKAVADLLGHSSISVTGDIYGHTSEDTARAAIDGVERRSGPVDLTRRAVRAVNERPSIPQRGQGHGLSDLSNWSAICASPALVCRSRSDIGSSAVTSVPLRSHS